MTKTKHDNWSKSGINPNFQTGCENNCRYCYAHSMGERLNWSKKLESWDKPLIRDYDVKEKHRFYNAQVMCFGSHDITENNVASAIEVLRKLLDWGNKVVIISKPRLVVIKRLCEEFQKFKENLVFRFTITTTNQDLMSFWEGNAPSYEERKACLKYVYDDGWTTSVSAEPILDINDSEHLVDELLPYVNHSLWFGPMSDIDKNVQGNTPEIEEAKNKIKNNQTAKRLKELVRKHYLNPLIFWKNDILTKLGWETPPRSAMDIEHIPKELKWLRWLESNRIADRQIGIERITGSNRVLVVAPHAFMGDGNRKADDEMTGKLAQQLSEKNGFYALINNSYKKVKRIEQADKNEHLVNCRSIEQVQKHLPDEFMLPFLSMVEEIKLKYGKPIIIFVHGIDDENIANEVKNKTASVLIGIGPQEGREDENIYSANVRYADRLVGCFRDCGIVAEKASKTSQYRGGFPDNINQYFRLDDSIDYSVQSFQLEIKKKGHRDTPENVEKTAEAIGAALRGLIDQKVEVVQLLPAVVQKGEISDGHESDEKLVTEAYLTLSEIFSKHFEKAIEDAMLEAGNYIIEKFYNNDRQLARKKEPSKGASLNQLIKRLQKSDNGAPSKSWIYNAVNLAVDAHYIGGFQAYGKLSPSQKVALLPIDDLDKKKFLATEAIKNKMSVRQLQKRVAAEPREIASLTSTAAKSLPKLLKVVNKPEIVCGESCQPLLASEALLRETLPDLEKIYTRAKATLDEINRKIVDYRQYAMKYEGMLERIETAKAKKSLPPIKPAKPLIQQLSMYKKATKPRLISVSRRTDIPAFYGEWFMNRVRAGRCLTENPIIPGQISEISLKREDVACFIFWTRWPKPLMPYLSELDNLGLRYYFQYTIVNYPRFIDLKSPNIEAAIRTFKELADQIGPKKVIWRYDPLIFTKKTDPKFHLEKFSDVAKELNGYSQNVVLSIVDEKPKNRERMAMLHEHGYQSVKTDDDISEEMASMFQHMSEIAKENGMRITSCGEKINLDKFGISPGKCIDGVCPTTG